MPKMFEAPIPIKVDKLTEIVDSGASRSMSIGLSF
jgi:hypothetical protein